MVNSKSLLLASSILIMGGLGTSCSQSGGNSVADTGISASVYESANKALDSSGFSGFKPTGEVHVSGTPPVAEIIFSNGEKTVEVDIDKNSGKVVELEEEVELNSIPENIVEAAKTSGVDLSTCGIYQVQKTTSGEINGYEFDDCERSMKDVQVDADSLKVDVESNDTTTRDS